MFRVDIAREGTVLARKGSTGYILDRRSVEWPICVELPDRQVIGCRREEVMTIPESVKS